MKCHDSRTSNGKKGEHIRWYEIPGKLARGLCYNSIRLRDSRHDKRKTKMPPTRTRLVIPGMCDEGPPSYAELETDERVRIRREVALSKVEENKTYCVHFSSIREILTSQELQDKISSYSEEARVHIEYFHEVPAGTPQDSRNLWLRKVDTGEVTITNTKEAPWDTAILLFLPDGASPVNANADMMDIYTAMVIGARSQERDFSDKDALDRSKEDVHTPITYVLGRVEAAASTGLDDEMKHRLTMAQLTGMPIEMLDRKYNLYRMENQGIDLDEDSEYRTYQTFHEMAIAPPSHEQMADIIIEKAGRKSDR